MALAWRLQRGALLGWASGMVTCGAVFGSIADGIGDLLGDSEQAQEIFERMGGPSGLVDAFLASLAGIYGMVVALYGVQATLRLRAEEIVAARRAAAGHAGRPAAVGGEPPRVRLRRQRR